MAEQVQPDYIENNVTHVQNSTRLTGTSVFVGGPMDNTMSAVQLNAGLVNSLGTFVGIDGHRN